MGQYIDAAHDRGHDDPDARGHRRLHPQRTRASANGQQGTPVKAPHGVYPLPGGRGLDSHLRRLGQPVGRPMSMRWATRSGTHDPRLLRTHGPGCSIRRNWTPLLEGWDQGNGLPMMRCACFRDAGVPRRAVLHHGGLAGGPPPAAARLHSGRGPSGGGDADSRPAYPGRLATCPP